MGIRADARALRDAAREKGEKHYFTGRPCKRGHVCNRTVAHGICVECNAERARIFCRTSPEKKAEADRAYRLRNAEKVRIRQERWHLLNPGANAERARRWAKENQDKVLQYSRIKRARRRGAEGTHTAADIANLFAAQHGFCNNCACSIQGGYHVDHIMPLKLGGRNDVSNLQLLCAPCNMRKHAKHPDIWAAQEARMRHEHA
ncbi:HNH endonuclease signature motif containing protein [Roseomonas mucosa]|uniref:HNH endonuclease n=1 Tax=Roseomonas mucosa TaxID=207340 RepID=UPI0030D043BB